MFANFIIIGMISIALICYAIYIIYAQYRDNKIEKKKEWLNVNLDSLSEFFSDNDITMSLDNGRYQFVNRVNKEYTRRLDINEMYNLCQKVTPKNCVKLVFSNKHVVPRFKAPNA